MIEAYGRLALRFLQMQREQWLPAEELERRQWRRFRKILLHAYAHSPYYRKKLDEAGISPDSIRDRSDLARIPITPRADLLDADRFLVPRQRPERMKTSFSSGSTGESARTYFDKEAWIQGRFLMKIRARLACGLGPWDRIAAFQADPVRNGILRCSLLRMVAFPIGDPLEETIRELRRYRPTVLYGPPSYLRRLGEKAEGDLKARLVFTSGETLEGSRESIERSFRAVVLDTYGCTEVKEIAWECPERSGHHVNADWLLVETVETERVRGTPDGEILITSLYNFGMPLIRYRLGDTGRLLAARCPCGRSLPLMAPRFGRVVDWFTTPDGKQVSPYSMINPVEVVPGVAQFQIVQESVSRVVVRVVPGHGFSDGSRDRIRAELAPLLPGVAIEIEAVAAIGPGPGGKFRIVSSKVPRAV
jgi:phenylacetate-CoA ligase